MNKRLCPYCHETADERETVKPLFIEEKTNCAAQVYIWNDQLHIETVYPNLDYHIPKFNFYKRLKIDFCPMCGRSLKEHESYERSAENDAEQ